MSLLTEMLQHLELAEKKATAAKKDADAAIRSCHAARQLLLGVSEPSVTPKGEALLLKLPSFEEQKLKRKTHLNKKASAAANG